MQTRQMFLVFGYVHDEYVKPQIFGVFDNIQSAQECANKIRENKTINTNPEVMPIHITIGKEENECQSFDFRKHIAFDLSKMELPVKCDMCMQHATHFCLIHRGPYCITHITNHEDHALDFYKKESVKLGNSDNEQSFSNEDVSIVCQQTGVSMEKAKDALKKSNGDVARAILLLTTKQ